MGSIARRAGSMLMRLLGGHVVAPTEEADRVLLYGVAFNARTSGGIINVLGGGVLSKAPTAWVDGAGLSWTTVARVTIAPGYVRASDDTQNIYLAASQIVDITVAGVNGLDTGVEQADTWYAVYLISSENGSLVGGLLSEDFTTPTLPLGYTKFRRIGCVRNGAGSDFLRFFQVGNDASVRRYWYDEARATLQVLTDGGDIAFTAVPCDSLVPPSSRNAVFGISFQAITVDGAVTDVLAIRPSGAASADGPAEFRVGILSTASMLVDAELPLGDDQAVEYLVTDADDVANLFILGFDDEF